jgi:hypothetical protein
MRKTIAIADLVATANHQLAYTHNREGRQAIAYLLEAALHDADAYAGFGYLPSELDGEHRLTASYDDTRRFYHCPVTGGRGGHRIRSLYEAVRWVVQDVRQSYEVSPVDAVKHARDTISIAELDTDSPSGWAYRLVLEAEPRLLDQAVQARYGYRSTDPSVPA